MKKTVKITRHASGRGTVVTVTLLEDGVSATYSYVSAATRIGESVAFCTRAAQDMLDQVRAEVDK